jgi:hypothetical protein
VPADADDATMEQCRVLVERRLSQVTDRAYEIVDRKDRHDSKFLAGYSRLGQWINQKGNNQHLK